MLTGTNLRFASELNYRIVLETVRLNGPMSRADVARRTGLTAQTISNISKRLIGSGLIRETHRIQEGRGAPATALEINPDGAFSIGLDLERQQLTGVLVDLMGTVRQRVVHEYLFPKPAESVKLLADASADLIEREGISTETIWGVGVGVPGPLGVSEGSTVTNIVNPMEFPGWKKVSLRDMLLKSLQLPVFLENNATGAAVGERWYGAGRHFKSFFYVYLGNGLGGGLIIDGHPFEGRSGNAAELGYLPVSDPPVRSLGLAGSQLGHFFDLRRTLKALRERGSDVDSAADLALALDKGDPNVLLWIETGAELLAPAILAIEYLIDPEAIVFGGRVPSSVLSALATRLDEILLDRRIDEKLFVPPLVIGSAGPDAAAKGVATLPLFEALAPAPRVLAKRSEEVSPANSIGSRVPTSISRA